MFDINIIENLIEVETKKKNLKSQILRKMIFIERNKLLRIRIKDLVFPHIE